MKLKTINLQDIDGYEFEKVCAEIFQNMNYGQVELTPPVGDAGKDIILHTPHGKIIVECKHYLNSSVGRPVIQKLHSAVISENGIKGMVVTTGRFSKNAIEHAKTLIPPIELVDFEILNDWALKANIDLVTSHKKSKIYSFPISSENRIENILASKLSNLLVSKPYQVQDQFLMKERNTKLIPLYVIGYRLNSVFKTSVGVIHQEYSEGKLFFSADSGELYPEGIIRYFHSSPMWEINPNELMDINVGSYRFRANDVKEAAVQYIIQTHTRTVRYTGRNNVSYSKQCVPKKSDIFISDVSQVYLPEETVRFVIFGKERFVHFADNGTPDYYTFIDNYSTCEICNRSIKTNGILCNTCGNISHNKKTFYSHGFYCKLCGKSLCRNCTFFYRKFLLFKVPVCTVCKEREELKNKKVKRYKPL